MPGDALPPPPDGARLLALDARRAVAGRLDVAHVLPQEGLAIVGATPLWPTFGVSLVQVVCGEGWAPEERTGRATTAVEAEALRRAWAPLWTEPALVDPGALPPDAAIVVLHYRGLLRTIGVDALPRALRDAAGV